LEGDAVEHAAGGPPGGPESPAAKVVANLPYAISTPWMDAVLSGPLPARMVLMLQKEAAERYASAPGGRSFGAISIFLQAAYDTPRATR
jgi:16S rRNA (adenine1518-N6/adenine1519-N6)-dimethyltransferase